MTQRHECGGTYIGVSECTRREEYDGIGGGSKWGVSIYDGTGSPLYIGPLFAMHGTLEQPQPVRRKEDPNNNALLLCHCNRNGVHIDSNSSARTHHNNIYMSSVLHFPIDGENTPLHHR